MPRRGRAALAAAAGLLTLAAVRLFSEDYTLSSAYPSPSGVYQRLTTLGRSVLARDGGDVLLNPAGNGAVVLGGTTPAPGLRLDVRGRAGFQGDVSVTNGSLQVQGGVVRADGGLKIECRAAGTPAPTEPGRLWVEGGC